MIRLGKDTFRIEHDWKGCRTQNGRRLCHTPMVSNRILSYVNAALDQKENLLKYITAIYNAIFRKLQKRNEN